MNKASWIAGLMKHFSEEVGFIPLPTLEEQYVSRGRYLIQHDYRGRAVGYILHGALVPGSLLCVTQHVIEADKQLLGYGRETFTELVERARRANCSAIKVRCATSLPAFAYWRAVGLSVVDLQHPDTKRQRAIAVMRLDLWPALWRANEWDRLAFNLESVVNPPNVEIPHYTSLGNDISTLTQDLKDGTL